METRKRRPKFDFLSHHLAQLHLRHPAAGEPTLFETIYYICQPYVSYNSLYTQCSVETCTILCHTGVTVLMFQDVGSNIRSLISHLKIPKNIYQSISTWCWESVIHNNINMPKDEYQWCLWCTYYTHMTRWWVRKQVDMWWHIMRKWQKLLLVCVSFMFFLEKVGPQSQISAFLISLLFLVFDLHVFHSGSFFILL